MLLQVFIVTLDHTQSSTTLLNIHLPSTVCNVIHAQSGKIWQTPDTGLPTHILLAIVVSNVCM